MSRSHHLFKSSCPVRLVDGLNINYIFTISGEASLWGSSVYNKNPN